MKLLPVFTAIAALHLLLVWCRGKISVALTFSLWLIEVVDVVLSWMKNVCAATAVVAKVFPFHFILNTRTKFFCNKLHEDIITPKKIKVLGGPNLCLLILPGDGRNRATTLGPLLCPQFRFISVSPLCTISFTSTVF